ncbi:hypothetical protein AKJ16_DCAP17581 [Drosera capensis]
MQRKRQARRTGDPFGFFGGPEWRSFALGRDPFDDPFFNGCFHSMFPSYNSVAEGDCSSQLPSSPTKPLIQELNSDDDMDVQDLDGDGVGEPKRRSSGFDKEPFVDHHHDDVDLEKEHVNEKYNKADTTQSDSFKYRYCKVTYGRVDGAFYTSTSIQRMGADGSLMEECKEADKTTGQATHRISRGIKDKGHSLTRKLKSDGKVETVQTLHNLQEDDLTNFNEAWKGSTEKHMPTWDLFSILGNTGNVGSSSSAQDFMHINRLHLPGAAKVGGTTGVTNEEMDRPAGRTKKIIRINIE